MALNIVAFIFLLEGLSALYRILSALAHKNVMLDLSVLGIPIFFGLRAFSPGWRTCALLFTWLGIFLSLALAAISVLLRTPVAMAPFQLAIDVPPQIVLIAATVAFLLCVWQYRVLTRPEIRALFLPQS